MVEKIAIILLLNIIFYWKTIYFKYVSDDILSRNRGHYANKWLNAFWVFEGHLKSNEQVDHFITLMLHALVCVGIYFAFGANNVSFIAALLFSVNPINNQGAVWISGRGYVLSALGMVWALVLPFEGAVLMLLGATYSNAGFLMPLALIGSSRPYLLIIMPVLWLFHSYRFKRNVVTKMKQEVFTEDKTLHPRKLILATKTFGFYVLHSLLPIRTSFYHSLLESIAGSKRYRAYTLCRFFWTGAGFLALAAWYVCFHKWDTICFCILWWCVGIAPFLNIYRMQQEIGERYAYVPNVGLMVILATFIAPYPYLVAGFFMMFFTKAWFYINGYKDDFWLVEYARFNAPDSWFAWHIAAMKRWEVASYQEAVIFWVMARLLSPKEFKLLYNLAAALTLSGRKKEGEELLAEAEKNIPAGQEESCTKLITDFRKGNIVVLV